jgi:hypothetical protein
VRSVVHALELAELLEEESYAQWQDVGPNHEDDFDFVLGRATKPQNTLKTQVAKQARSGPAREWDRQ